MSAEPCARATLIRLLLRRAEALWPGDAPALRAALGTEGLARLLRSPGHEFVPMALEVDLVRAVHARRGDAGALRLGKELVPQGALHPLLRPVIAATLGMMGRRPGALAQIVPALWRVGTRDAGRLLAADSTAGEVAFAHAALPEVLRDHAWLLRLGGMAEGVMGVAGLSTSLAVEWTPGAAAARLRVRWRRPAEATPPGSAAARG